MIIKGIIDEDFVNYKKPSMFLGTCFCDLKCCREKGHETCDTCGFNRSCTTLQRRDQQPQYRRMKIESEQRQKS